MVDELDIVLRVIGAAGLGALVGFNRAWRDKPAGIRTHMLVAGGSALFVGMSVLLSEDLEALGSQVDRIDGSRVLAGVVTGVGFLGAGAIIRHGGHVSGLTTAAGIWMTAAVGCAVGFGFWAVGVAASVFMIFVYAASLVLPGRVRSEEEEAA